MSVWKKSSSCAYLFLSTCLVDSHFLRDTEVSAVGYGFPPASDSLMQAVISRQFQASDGMDLSSVNANVGI